MLKKRAQISFDFSLTDFKVRGLLKYVCCLNNSLENHKLKKYSCLFVVLPKLKFLTKPFQPYRLVSS